MHGGSAPGRGLLPFCEVGSASAIVVYVYHIPATFKGAPCSDCDAGAVINLAFESSLKQRFDL